MFKIIKERFRKRKKLAKNHPEILRYEEMEQRVLFSADVVPGLDTAAVEEQVIVQDVGSDAPVEREEASETVEQPAEEARSELVLVNENVTDYEQLIADLQGDDDHRIIEVVVLESDRDGIEQVSDILSERSDLAAVHVITHGTDAQINLGDSWLNSAILQQNSDAVAGWGNALTETGDILFYGCNIAADSDGQVLLDYIAQLTGADVAASDDLTGNTQLGGDWDLEYLSGTIETEISVRSNSQEGWSHLLAAPTFWDYHHTIDLAELTAVVDYPVKLELTEGANGFNHANAQANGDDIRFYDSAGTELSYWIENWNPGGTSTVWVKVTTAGASSIDMYYGNAGVAATSDASATFYYYDDFEDDSVGALPTGWTLAQGAPTGTPPSIKDDGGNLIFSDGNNNGGPVVSTGNWADIVVSQDFRTSNSVDAISHAGLIARYADVDNMVYGGIVDKDTAQIWYRNGGTFTQIGGDWSITALNVNDTNWHNQELRLFGDTVELYIDETFIGSASLAATGAPASGSTGFWSQYSGSVEAYRDNHIVRSYDAGTGDIATTLVNEGFAIDENSANGTVVGHPLATDPEGDTLTYSITAGNTDGAFTINSSTGQITVANNAALDFETNPTFSLTIQVEDIGTLTDTATVSINLNDLNEAPAITSDGGGAAANINIAENTTAVTTVTATDADLDTLTYSIDPASDDADKFSIDSSTGVLTFKSAPDFENPTDVGLNNVYDVTVQVSDGNGGTDSQAISVTVTNSDELFIVTNTADSGVGSLRQAIIDANANANSGGPDVITFNIGADGSQQTINLLSALDPISEEIIIDGFSQYDALTPTMPIIELNGGGTINDGLTFASTSDGSVVQGFMITGFSRFGIQIDSDADGITIRGNWIGTTGTGYTGAGNDTGINIQGANTIIGGTGANDGNVITNNANEGINITGTGATGTIIQGNIIGLDPDGASGSGNADVGIALLSGANSTTIGGSTAAARNIISNNYEGIEINSNNNTVQGNYIGTDITGTLDRGNRSDDGVELQNGATGNLIGGTGAGEGNLISGNAQNGIFINNANNNTVKGNLIGTDVTGTLDLGNSADGIQISGDNNVIGGSAAGDRNVISGNNDEGIDINAGATGTIIQGNYVGTNASGDAAIPNGAGGVGNWGGILVGGDNTTVGGSNAGDGNLISGNHSWGIIVESNNNIVQGNLIGTAADGTTPLGNSGHGLVVYDFGGGLNNLIGGTVAGAGNLIANNGLDGISATGTVSASFLGNIILSNAGAGIDLGDDGVSANDADDIDTGSNALQNFPVITSAELSGTDLTLGGTLDTDGLITQYRIEFYGNASGTQDATNGEGRIYLGSTTVTTDGSGDGTFSSIVLAGVTLSSGDYVTATATRIDDPAQVGVDDSLAYGRTSEFALNMTIAATNVAPVVTASAGTTAYSEQAAATVIDAGITLVDADGYAGVDPSDQYTAVIQITGNYEAADILGFTNTSNIQGVLVGDTLTLSVIGGQTATIADFQAALRTVTFYNGSDTPSELDRTIIYSFDDGVDSSNLSTKTVQVTAVNDAPEGANKTVTTSEDTDYVFDTADFGFTDPSDNPADNFANVIITTTIANGTLYVDANGNGIVDGAEALNDLDTVSVADISAGRLKFKPAANASGTNYDSFTFQVQDDGGGADTDLTANTMTINVTAVNDAAPVAGDDAYTVSEDNTLTADWWNINWTRRQQLTFDNLAQAETLTNFPVLVILNSSNIDYAQTKEDGSDLRFFAADGTQLAYEIEQWDEGGDSSVWVRIPQISGSSNSDSIWMYYGNATAQPVTNAANVWDSNFVGVWHLNQEQSGTGNVGVYKDSTGTGNNGIDRVAATGQDGQVTDGQEFGTSDWIEIAHDASVDLTDSMTISFWIKPTSDSGTFNRVVEKGLWGYQDSYYFGGGNGTNDLTFYLNNQEVFDTADNVLTVGDWQHCAVSYTSNGDGTGSARLYINGVEVDTNGNPAGVAAPPIGTYNGGMVAGNTGRLAIGHENSSYDFDGFIDEVQISNTDRSADWIAAQYQATKNQFGVEFVKFGGEEAAPAIGGVLDNDSDVDNDPLTVSLVDGPDNAQSFTLNKDGTFTYTPTANYHGNDTFTYEVNDGNGGTTQAMATITVNPVNDAPTAQDKTITTPEDTTYTFTLSDFGYNDVDGDPIALVRILPIYANVVELDGVGLGATTHDISIADINNGKLTFEPPADITGTADFMYFVVNDGSVDSVYKTMAANITPVNDAPVANNDPGVYSSTIQDLSPLGYWRLGESVGAATDLGSSANNGTYNGGTLGQTGGLFGDADTAVQFNGSSDYVEIAHSNDYLLDNGTFQLWFNADNVTSGDLQHLFSKDAQGFVTGGHVSMYLNTSGQLEVRLQSTTTDYIVRSTSLVSDSDWHHAAFSFGSNGMALYLDGDLVDSDSYTGGLGTSSGGTGNVEGIAIGAGTQNSTSPSINPVNQMFTGSIDEVALFGQQLNAQTILRIYDAGANQLMVGENGSLNLSANSGVLANDTDVDGDILTVVEINGSAVDVGSQVTLASGALVTLNSDGSIDYDPNGQFESLKVNETASDTFNYMVSDGNGETDTATTTITIVGENDAPVINNGTFAIDENSINGTTVGNVPVTDPDAGDTHAYTITAGNTGGAFTIDNSGNIAVANSAALNFETTPFFTLTVQVHDQGGTGQIDTATITVNLNDLNEAPVAREDRVGLTFDGVDDYVRIGDYPGLAVSNSVTMEAWIRPSGAGTGTQIIVNKEGEYEFAITSDTGEIKWSFANTDPGWGWHNTGYFAQAGEWTHIAVTYNNGVVNTYADGALVDTYNGTGVIADEYPVFNELQIGGRENAVTQRFDGQINEVRVWDTERTQLEIQTNMNTLLAGNETGLLGNWRFDEGSGTTVSDQSVNGHHGTLADGVTVAEMPTWEGYVVSEDGTLNVSAANGVLANDFDIDGDPLTAVLDSGPSNAASFTLNPDGSFTYTPVANFNGVDNFTYHANDGTADSNIVTVTIRVDPANDAPVINNATFTLDEKSTNGTSVGNVTVTDNDAGDTHVYSITAGNTGGTFAIDNAGNITVANSTALDFETTPVFTLMVQVQDQGGTGLIDTATITVNVNDINEFVPIANDATVAINEDAANGTSVHSVVATDGDATANLTYSIIGGNADGVFAIDANTGEITIADNTNLDRETTASYSLTVEVSDATNTDNATITVNVGDVDEFDVSAVTDSDVAANTVAEDAIVGTSVGLTGLATDADATDNVTYSLSDDAGGRFAIDSGTGVVTVNGALDYEVNTSHSVTVLASSSDGSTSSQAFTINVTDVSEGGVGAISDSDGAADAVDEDALVGATVGVTANAVDPDGGDTVTYSLDNDAGGLFTIDANTGVVTLAAALDAEGATGHDITLRATSSDTSFSTTTLSIAVNDINEFVPVANDATVGINEAAANGTSVHSVVATDQDATANLTYSIIGGNADGVFTIDANTGEITIADNTNLDRETTASYGLAVQVSDGTNTDNATITVNVGDINEFAPVANDATVVINEDAANGATVHTVVATDADATANLTYSITGGNADGVFTIDANTGEITIADNTNLDRETTASYGLTVQVSDGTNTDNATITVNVADVDEFVVGPVTDSDVAANTVAEDAGAGAAVGVTALADDADATDNVTYSLSDDAGGLFAIDANTGVITVANALDFETATIHSVTVLATSSDTSTSSQAFTVSVTDINESAVGPVSDIDGSANSVTENASVGDAVGIIALATDPDGIDTVTYSLSDDAGGLFAIDANTGVITVANALDYETATSHSVTVLATSSDTSTSSQAFTINVTDINESAVGPVTDNDGTANTVAEDAIAGTTVGITALATDADGTDTVTYSLSDDAGGLFTIDANTGVITVANPLDYETATSHSVTVLATSSDTSTSSQVFTINVTGINEAPVINNTTFALDENTTNGTAVGTVPVTDPDAGESHVYSITAGNTGGAFAIDNAGNITVADSTALNFETTPVFTLIVQVQDQGGTGLIDTATITVNLNDLNVAPVINNATFNLDENSANGTAIGTVPVTDPDAGDTHVYSITAGNTGGAFAIDNTGNITVANSTALDFETTPVFTLTVQVQDQGGTGLVDTATITVNLNNLNEVPISLGIANVTVGEDAPNTVIDLFAAFADTEDTDANLTYTITANTNPGLFTATPIDGVAGTLTLDYAPNAFGTADITVRATDTSALWVENTFTVTVNPVNDTPATLPVNLSAISEDSGSRLITQDELLANATDVDSPALTATNLTLSAGSGTLVDNGDGTWDYTPAANDDTSVSFTYTVTDGSLTAAGSATLDITPVNDAPVINNDSATVDEGQNVVINLLGNDADVDNALDLNSITITAAPTNGSLVDNGDGTLTYTHDGSKTISDRFSYTINDVSGATSNIAAVSLTVSPANDNDSADSTDPDPILLDDPVTDEDEGSDVENPTYEAPVEDSITEDEVVSPVEAIQTPQDSADVNESIVQVKDPQDEETQDIIYLTDEIDRNVQPEERNDDRAYIYYDNDLYKDISLSKYLSFNGFSAENEPVAIGLDDVNILDFDSDETDPVVANEDYDALRQEIDESFNSELKSQGIKAKIVTVTAATFTVGIVSYLLRAGSLVASMMSALPLWRGFDPIAIFSGNKKKKNKQDEISDAGELKPEAFFEGDAE